MLDQRKSFDLVVTKIIELEGGYVESPHDPGGETKYGISKRAHPAVDIKSLTKKEAAEIYRVHYWNVIKGGDMPLPVAMMLMDHAVNAGPGRAVMMMQTLVGSTVDGIVGPSTLSAIDRGYARHGDRLLKWYSRDRMMYYTRLKHWKHWGNGWTQRVQEVTILATRWSVALDLLKLQA